METEPRDGLTVAEHLLPVWLREMRALDRELLLRLAGDKNADMRREVIEAAGDARKLGGNLFLRMAVQASEAGEDFGVSCALAAS